MSNQDNDPSRDERALARHIFPSSGTMFGICVTLAGLVKVAEGHIGPSHVDQYLALTATLFLVSALGSYLSIRHSKRPKFAARCEVVADKFFLVGLFSIVTIALCFAYEVI
ncbi:MAG: hypothetical protein H0X34_19145 [Chthoniobacterales bacterium]|nr:hypothetical protein [Chthoniobacterales bacterium]